ncbi:beta-N-acetylhexosaminidase [Paenibacillaceae bacterium WGS1546]|uniref:beta-N-acetylhexosaminidase n=1 Tax=Cohnella sp. WGS1546 TaxID=3366810 RepID=UPI00372D788C
MKSRFVPRAFVFCLCLLILLVSGCGGGGHAEPSSPSPSAGASASPGPTNAVPPADTATPEPPDDGVPDPSSLEPIGEIERILAGMTLEQKVGQLLIAGIQGTKIDSRMKEIIARQHVGGIIWFKNNFSGLEGSVLLANELKKANEGNPVPLFMSVDQEGGKVSRLPAEFAAMPDAAKVGKTGDPELAERMGALLAKQLAAIGFNVDFAPVLDVNSNPKNPVIGSRSFGSDADTVAKMGVAAMKGLQESGTIAVVKHFPGHGDTAEDSHVDLPVVTKSIDRLEALEWVPFRAAIEQGADAVMIAHILFPEIDPDAPASLSEAIISGQLRGTLGFEGVVMTDDLTMGAIADRYGIDEAALLSVEAGSDIVLVAHGYDNARKTYDRLLSAARSGRLPESRIDESVRRIVALKLKYSLSDAPIPVPAESDLPNDEIREWLDRL